MRGLITALLVIAMLVLAAVPSRAEGQPRLKIVIPAHLVAMTGAQTPPPPTPLPKQTNGAFIAAVVALSAIAVIGVVVTVKYGD